MKARSVSQFLRDVTASKAAQRQYRRRASELRELAHQHSSEAKPLTARKTRYYAVMCDHAAQAEFFDPEPRA